LRTGLNADAAARLIIASLDEDKAEDIVSIDIKGKSSVADRLVIASGRSQRHVASLAEHLIQKLKEAGGGDVRVEGLPHADWVLIDAGDVIVHLFRAEVRSYYDLEGMWSVGEKGAKPRKPERVGSAA
jgi:ribosome-associated protein